MPDVTRLQRVVSAPINRIRIWTDTAQELAPRVGRLQIYGRGRPQRRLKLKRVVVGVAKIRLQGCAAELWIGPDKVLWESVETQHRALDTGRNHRQAGIVTRGVVQRVKGVGEGQVIAIRQIVAQVTGRGGPKLPGPGLQRAANDRSHRSGSRAADEVDSFEHLVQQRRFPSATRGIEGFL